MSAVPHPVEKPQEAARRLAAGAIRDGFQPDGLHCYRSADGAPWLWRIRLKHPDGRKWIRPTHWDGAGYVIGEPEAPTDGKPLYHLPELLADPAAPVWIVEGEPCAEALAKLGMVATTSGSADSAAACDWTPLKGRNVLIWPDNDPAGAKYADDVAARLSAIGCPVERLDVGALGLPEKGDCVDWLKAHPTATAADILALPTSGSALRPNEGSELGHAVLEDVRAFLRRFVAYPSEHASIAHTLWVAHAHLMDRWDNTPRIAFLSPEPGSGKSRALEVTAPLVPRSVIAVNVSPAYLFRKVSADEGRPTLLYDEIDTVFGPKAKDNEDIRGLLNAGYRKGASAGRCVMRGKTVELEELPAYCAVALAGLGSLPDTILTRCVIVRMRRRAPNERVEPYRERIERATAARLMERLAAWCNTISEETSYAELPTGIEDRAADLWEPLLTVADAAGGRWPHAGRLAALALVREGEQRVASLGVQLLGDLSRVFAESEAMPTAAILAALHALEESPWGDLHGKPLDARRLGRELGKYEVKPKTIRFGHATAKGYSRADLSDAWARYVSPMSPAASVTTETAVTGSEGATAVTAVTDVTQFGGHAGGNLEVFDL